MVILSEKGVSLCSRRIWLLFNQHKPLDYNGNNLLPLTSILHSLPLAVWRTKTSTPIHPVAEASCFHVFRKSSQIQSPWANEVSRTGITSTDQVLATDPERQLSSTNQPSFHSASLELFAQDLLRNQRFRLGLRTGITSTGQVLPTDTPHRDKN